MAATNGTTTGADTANWLYTATLVPGSNNLLVVVTDGSSSANQTTDTVVLTYYPYVVDMDGDGLDDTYELAIGTAPNEADTDGDGINDNVEIAYDGDGTFFDPSTDTDPLLGDTDGDTLPDNIDPNPLVADVADGDLAPLGAPDGNLNVGDLVIMNRIVTDQLTPGPIELLHGDLYPDGVLNIQDLLLQQQLILQ